MNAGRSRFSRRALPALWFNLTRVLLAIAVSSAPAWAQGEVKGASGAGSVAGRVLDARTGAPLEGATVSVTWLDSGSDAREQVEVSDSEGSYRFASVPAGIYIVNFSKPGYRTATVFDFEVKAGQESRADFPLPPLPTGTGDPNLAFESFVVEASVIDDIMSSLELRLDSDALVNVMSAEEIARFAAGDVGEAIRRVAGVNVVEGQFAIIRGLEDRYSSTLYNSAPIPSPDPDRQSVQLDLFPAEVVSNLLVVKTFVPDLPSNSAGGSIDIITIDYPDEELELELKAGSGFNSNAIEEFREFEAGTPVGNLADGLDTVESELGGLLGGRGEYADREIRFMGGVNREVDYETAEGFQESLEPRRAVTRLFPRPPTTVVSGGLSLGELDLSAGRFDLSESERAQQTSAYGGFGFDLDEEGRHKLDFTTFYTDKSVEVVQYKNNGYLPNFDYDALAALPPSQSVDSTVFFGYATPTAWISQVRADRTDFASRGPVWFASFLESKSFKIDRSLLVPQINGDHDFEAIEGLHVRWAANYAKARQDEEAFGMRFFFEPDDVSRAPREFPVTVEALGAGQYAANNRITFSSNEIDETQYFGRLDADYELRVPGLPLDLTIASGGWYEQANRDVASNFSESPTLDGLGQFAIFGDTPQELGRAILGELDTTLDGELAPLREATNESSREIWAWNGSTKATLFEQLDLLGGLRLESLLIESQNDPFTGELALDGTPSIFPTKYLFLDRLDNLARGEDPPQSPPFNDELLGLEVPLGPCLAPDGSPAPRPDGLDCVDLTSDAEIESLLNGRIDEKLRLLPSTGITWRTPLDGLVLRGAWSQTVARPSFREMGYYVSVEPGSDDLIVGNPQLRLSDVESYDSRAEYVFGDRGDLVAFSGFYKIIDDPIESIVIRNPVNFDRSASALFRTFFNNPNQATLWGIEAEGRKNLGFLGAEFLENLTIGGNYTYIQAEVGRTDAELARSAAFFGVAADDEARFTNLAPERRLFGQPEWIANADITFDHPDWGTKVTLAFFAISDVLDAAGSASVGPDGVVESFVPDRYIDSFYQLDLNLIQTMAFDALPGDWDLPGEWTLKVSAKNLTDSTRKIVYDPDQTRRTFTERSFKIGRDFSLSLTYKLAFPLD